VYPGAHAKTQPHKPALIMAGTGRTITFAELDERSNRLGQWWYAAGLRTGDGVAMLVTNIPETLEIYWAAIRSGSTSRRSTTTTRARGRWPSMGWVPAGQQCVEVDLPFPGSDQGRRGGAVRVVW